MQYQSHNQSYERKAVVISIADFAPYLFNKLTNSPEVQARFTPSELGHGVGLIYQEMLYQIFEIIDADLNIFWTNMTNYPDVNKMWKCGNPELGLLTDNLRDPLYQVLKSVMSELAYNIWQRLREYNLLDGRQVYPERIAVDFLILGVAQHALQSEPVI
jgi:hypothetical protein